MEVLLLGVVAVLVIVLFQIVDERKIKSAVIARINCELTKAINKNNNIHAELRAAEKAAQMLASYQDECN